MFSPQHPILPRVQGCLTLAEALARSATAGDRGVRLIQSTRSEERLSYAGLRERALSTLGHLQRQGLRPGQRLVLVTDDLALFTAVFWAGALGGIVIVPIAVPANDAGHEKLANVLRVLGDAWLAADQPASVCARLGEELLPAPRRLPLSREIFGHPAGTAHAGGGLDDVVLIQFSSGSTGQPKGVQITSRNLLANVSGIADRCALSADSDRMLNWMPLTHDFGIVFCHVMPTVFGVEQALIATPTFMRHPLLWMQKASDLKATVSAGPNYAYHHFLKRFKPELDMGWDLTALRMVVNGAEPISCDLSREFFGHLARYGLAPHVATPGYGLAESTLLVSLCAHDAPFRSIWLDRGYLAPGALVQECPAGEGAALEFASVGKVGRNIELRITDADRRPLVDGTVGTIETRSVCVTPGYVARDDLSRQIISADGWLDTGDLGFVRDGELYITGRRKDLVIINGVNYYPHDIEATVAEVPPLDLNAVAACAVPRSEHDREGLALFIRSREDGAAFETLSERVRDHVLQKMGLPVDHCLAVRQIPKTTSGKVQRFLLMQQFRDGAFDDQLQAERAQRNRSALRLAFTQGDEAALHLALKAEAIRVAPQADWSDPQTMDQPLMELGLGSLRIVELHRRLMAGLGLDLPVSVMFDHPSLTALTRALMQVRRAGGAAPDAAAEAAPDAAPDAAPVASAQARTDSAIAVIGMACRFPGNLDTPETFWQGLLDGVDATGEFPAQRWDRRHNTLARTDRGAYLQGLDRFDHRFFRLTPAEAQRLDPQQRLLLTVSWEAFEHAGLDPWRLRGSDTGVYTGISGSDYAQAESRGGPLEDIGPHAFTGSAPSVASGRLSFFYGFEGPNMAVDTACSSALAAVHLAVRALRSGECNLALASAVNLILSPEMQVGLSRMNALSPDGRCKAFDASADGYGRGEGCGSVVLKRLDDALADGDTVLAVIRGSAMNHDGASNGLTAPNGAAQQKVIRSALRDAQWAPAQVDYVEAHGTGTALGDPIEAMALASVYGEARDANHPLRIGSVKTNVGHLEAAAGMASLLKVVMALREGVWPASLHLQQPNPRIPWERLPLEVVDRAQTWTGGSTAQPVVRRAGISAFGMSGTNVHLLLEAAPGGKDAPAAPVESALVHSADADADEPGLLLLSARTETDLVAMAHRLADWLAAHPGQAHDMARTLACHRSRFGVRWACTEAPGQGGVNWIGALRGVAPSGRMPVSSKPGVVFVFPGQGSQHGGAFKALYDREPVVRASLDRSQAVLDGELERPLLDLLFDGSADELARTEVTQAVTVAGGLALWDLWTSWGLTASAVTGHSVGDIAAAAACGAISRESALRFAARRGRLMARMAPGGMLAVQGTEGAVRALLEQPLSQGLAIAAVNGARSITLAGEHELIAAAEALLAARSMRHSRLAVSRAFHSAMVDPILPELRALSADILQVSQPALRWVSCVTAQEMDAATVAEPDFWCDHARQPVRLRDTISALHAPASVFIELGARPVFSTLAELEWPDVTWLSSGAARSPLLDALTLGLGRAHEAGLELDLMAVFRTRSGRTVHLPSYPFQGTTPMLPTVRAESQETFTAAGHAPLSPPRSAPMVTPLSPRAPSGVREELARLAGKISGLQPQDILPQANWFALGLDSLLVLQLQQALCKAFKVDIKLNDVFEHGTTLDDLTALVERHLPASVEPAPAHPTANVPAHATAHAPAHVSVSPWASAKPTTPNLPASGELEGLLTAQVEALSRLFQQQLAVLQGAGLAVPAPTSAGAAPGSMRPTTESPSGSPGSASASVSVSTSVAKPASAPAVEVKGLYRQIPGRKAQWSEARASHVGALARAYAERTPGSKAATQDGREVYANPRAVIGFRPEWKEMTYPLHVDRADGAHVWDVDGHRYVDITMGFGATLLGHNPPFVRQALVEELERGAPLGPQTPHALDVARLIASMTGTQRVGFFTTGSEAVMVAVRLARAVTQRQRIVIFTNAYHGTFDGFLAMGWVDEGRPQTYPLADGTPPRMVEDVVVLRYGDPRSLEVIRDMVDELAAVLVEPVQSRDPTVQPREFLHELRHITAESGSALIFDEMIMGFRVHPGGAQHHFGVEADICTYGKIVGGGMPIGVVAGKARFLDAIDGGVWHYGDDSVPRTRTAFVAGTFNSHPLSMVAAKAVLHHLQAQGPELQEKLNARTAAMAARLNAVFEREQAPIRCIHFSSLFRFDFADDTEVLNYHLLQQGVFVWEGRNCFLSTAHTDEDVDFIVEAVERGLRAMRDSGYLGVAAASPTEHAATQSQAA